VTGDGTADALRARLRRDLIDAMRAGLRDDVAVIRVIIGALDNAQATDAQPEEGGQRSLAVAGASLGVGSTEATPRALSSNDVTEILDAEMTELSEQADRYEALGQLDMAGRLRHQGEVVVRYRRGL
jgi:uncharacterized protein YqeY